MAASNLLLDKAAREQRQTCGLWRNAHAQSISNRGPVNESRLTSHSRVLTQGSNNGIAVRVNKLNYTSGVSARLNHRYVCNHDKPASTIFRPDMSASSAAVAPKNEYQ